MELLKLLSANEIAAQVVSFAILLFILSHFMWKPFLKALDARKEKIASEFKRIDGMKGEIAVMKLDYETRLGSIEDAARLATQNAIDEGKRMAKGIEADARREVERTIENAKEAIHAESLKAMKELKEDIVNITINIAEKVIEERLTPEMDKKLVESFLKRAQDLK